MCDQNTMIESDNKEKDEIEMLREIRFANGITYEELWNKIDMASVISKQFTIHRFFASFCNFSNN